MCNLYSLTKGQATIRDWFRARHDRTGNLPLFPGIFPDQMAPIVRAGSDGERELVLAPGDAGGPAAAPPGPLATPSLVEARNKNVGAKVNNAVGGVKDAL
jgi:putative SOS response-associated peptidase YedK